MILFVLVSQWVCDVLNYVKRIVVDVVRVMGGELDVHTYKMRNYIHIRVTLIIIQAKFTAVGIHLKKSMFIVHYIHIPAFWRAN